MTNFQVQNYNQKNYVSYVIEYTPVTQGIPCLTFLMCVATMHQ